ncbi:MAG: EscU/YscU/HrcU family type III secretion system export apparatus switch protein [bacterium]|nr:EscU/YscU/HrcU family type III secretion system export apparatus switch protein [bacterium]
MPARSDTDQRTEQPTALRLAEARRKGQVARSSDLSAVAVLLAALVTLWLIGGVLLNELIAMFSGMLSFGSVAPDVEVATGGVLWSHTAPVAWITLCFCSVLVAAGICVGIVQVGLHASGEVITPQLDRLSIGQGLRRIFSSRGLVRATFALLKIVAVGLVAWVTISGQFSQIASACGFGIAQQGSSAWGMLGQMAWRVLVVLVVLAAIDWLWQWRKRRSDLMMTRREVLEDLRKTDGDPLMRAKRRNIHQAQAGDDS